MCVECGKRFHQPSHLRAHTQAHTGTCPPLGEHWGRSAAAVVLSPATGPRRAPSPRPRARLSHPAPQSVFPWHLGVMCFNWTLACLQMSHFNQRVEFWVVTMLMTPAAPSSTGVTVALSSQHATQGPCPLAWAVTAPGPWAPCAGLGWWHKPSACPHELARHCPGKRHTLGPPPREEGAGGLGVGGPCDGS